MTINDWAQRWNLPPAALTELAAMLMPQCTESTPDGPEGVTLSKVRLEAAQKGLYLWRNNVGAGTLDTGNFVRWGLANDSKNVNEVLKSADLIGIRKRLVTVHDVGRTIGQFVSRECKPAGWRYTHTPREQAQLRWAQLITASGGDAAIVSGVGTL